jgi:predicted AlkP superfamily phosphohydrolase/phosphomutase
MKYIMKVLAKEIRRVRVLIEFMEGLESSMIRINCRERELEILKRILGLMIKKELDKS